MADYKNNHYIPELILKEFRSNDSIFYYYDKKVPSRPISRRNISKIFSSNRIFWGTDDSGADDKTLESDFYSRLDNVAKTMIERIISSVRKGATPKFTKEEKSEWDDFVFFQMKRLPAHHNLKMDKAALDSAVQHIVEKIEADGYRLGTSEREYLRQYVETEQNLQNAKIYALQAPGQQTQGLLGGRGIGFARITHPRKSFIIGDWPFARLDPPLFRDPTGMTGEMWFPIAKDIAVSHVGRAGQERIIDASVSQIRQINEAIYKQSSEVGSSSAELLASLGDLDLPVRR